MTINLNIPDIRELKPRITVFGVGGAGGNAVNNMITAGLQGVDFVVANTDAQALTMSKAERVIQMGVQVTEGLGAGSQPDIGRAAAEEVIDEIRDHLAGVHMCFVTAGMGGGTGTGAAPVIAKAARDLNILTVGVVTKPFHFEGQRRMRLADGGITELHKCVDTLLIIPNQNLFRVANEKTTFADAFALADQVLYSGVACITDLMVKEGLINLDFADVRAVMREMGKAMMGTGEAQGEKRARTAAEAAISNPLIDDASMKGARGLLISITGGRDLTLYEVDEAATRIREEVDEDANIIVGATFDEGLDGMIRVSVVATGIDQSMMQRAPAPIVESKPVELPQRMRAEIPRSVERAESARPAAIATPAPMPAPTPVAPPAAMMPATMAPPLPLSVPASVNASIESAAKAAIASAVEDVTIRPLSPKPSLFIDPVASEPQASAMDMVDPAAFIPPQAERLPTRGPRMPRIDELPIPAQNEIRGRRTELQDDHPQKQRMSLLQRLTSVGLGRRDAEEEAPPVPRQVPVAPMAAERLPGRPMPRQAEPRQDSLPVSEYAKRPAPQGLDQHGRAAPVHNSSEEDQLDIPAFLRRQAN
ncbi:MAG TPA: cell division protein FtsZ [Xanthobacteraceae bacterium]|jgi:cell division protein FtsZ|nr:cell division protein FtsZ [Xanthobacteraceae bacterium]